MATKDKISVYIKIPSGEQLKARLPMDPPVEKIISTLVTKLNLPTYEYGACWVLSHRNGYRLELTKSLREQNPFVDEGEVLILDLLFSGGA